MKKILFSSILLILISTQFSYSQITKAGQFTFFKNYDASGYFAVNDSIIFCNNVVTGKFDIINLFQRKVITSLNYTITGKNNSLTWDNAQDGASIYFVGIQNTNTYFIKLRKTDFSEVWKIRIDQRPDIGGYPCRPIKFSNYFPFTIINNKIVFFSGGNIFHNKNSTVDIPVSPGLVIYDTSGYMLSNNKITNPYYDGNCGTVFETSPGNPQLINRNNTLIVGFSFNGLYNSTNTIRTDSFDISPINGPSNVNIGSSGYLTDPTVLYPNAFYTWTNKNTSGTWTSSNTKVLTITRVCPQRATYCDILFNAVGLGTTLLTYTYTSTLGKKVTTSMPINVVQNSTPFDVIPNYCFMEFDQNLNYINSRFTVGQPQGGYYDAISDSVTIYGTDSKVFVSDTKYKSGSTFNFKYSFKSLNDTAFVFNTYTGSAGAGSNCYFNAIGDKQFYYLPFTGSVLYKQPYTSIGTENFLTGLMDNNNRSIIDESKSVFFRNLQSIKATFSKGEKFQFLATDNNDFYSDVRYTNTGLYIMVIDKNGVVNPDSLTNKSACPPPTITYIGSNQVCLGSSITLSSSTTFGNQWYKDGLIINGATGSTYSAISAGNYTDTVINTTGCKSGSAITTIVTIATPTKPIITRDVSNNLVSSSSTGNQWYTDTTTLITGQTTQSYKPSLVGYYAVKATLNNCSSPFSDKYYYLITALTNFNNGQFIHLYPNPTSNDLIVDYNLIGQSQVSVKILDLNGKILITKNKISKGGSLNVRQLIRGTYFVQIVDKANQLLFTDKLIKE
jgi:hypothetical protein